MIARWIAAALVTVGVVLYAAVAVPMRRQAQVAADDYRRARDEARDMRARLARLERRDAAHLRAASALAGATPASTVRTVRRSVVQTLQGARVSGVRLGVTAAACALRRPRPFDRIRVLLGGCGRWPASWHGRRPESSSNASDSRRAVTGCRWSSTA
jgi:hypothetical protein